jgi:integrase
MLLYSPLAGVKPFNEAKHRKPPRAISCTEEPRILMCCDTRLRLIVIVLLYTGMRVRIEALRLKWADVDFEEAVITVTQSKTAAGLRALPMTEFVASELQKWYAATERISEYVCFNPQRPSTLIQSVKTTWHHALKLVGIPRFPIYQCRLPVSPHFRDPTWGIGCVGHDYRPTPWGIRHEACSVYGASPRRISETRSICWKNCKALRQGSLPRQRSEGSRSPSKRAHP